MNGIQILSSGIKKVKTMGNKYYLTNASWGVGLFYARYDDTDNIVLFEVYDKKMKRMKTFDSLDQIEEFFRFAGIEIVEIETV